MRSRFYNGKYLSLMSECHSSLIASFHLNQYKCNNTLNGFGSGPKRILAILEKNFMSTYVDFLTTILMNQYHCGILITALNSLWFPTTTESRCFDVPTHKNVCTYVLDFGCRASLKCHSTQGWIIFTDGVVNLLCFHWNIWELNLMRPELSPSCSHLGRRVVY